VGRFPSSLQSPGDYQQENKPTWKRSSTRARISS
jgi:hypothetical protein